MKRRIARLSTWWLRLFVLSIFVLPVLGVSGWLHLVAMAGLFALALVRPPSVRDRAPVPTGCPVRGRWVALNSPASKVPSHGTRAYGQTYAIDILHPRPTGSPTSIGWGSGMQPPEQFSTFGERVSSVAGGRVVAVSGDQRDHRTRLTWPSLIYMITVESFCRELGGARFVLGNHVVIDHGDGVFSAYGHLRRGSLTVTVGDRVDPGQPLGEVGNSGNSSEPHLHVQLMDDAAVTRAAGIPFRWDDIELSDDIDPTIATGPPPDPEPGVPANGQIFIAAQDGAAETGGAT